MSCTLFITVAFCLGASVDSLDWLYTVYFAGPISTAWLNRLSLISPLVNIIYLQVLSDCLSPHVDACQIERKSEFIDWVIRAMAFEGWVRFRLVWAILEGVDWLLEQNRMVCTCQWLHQGYIYIYIHTHTCNDLSQYIACVTLLCFLVS